MKSFGLSQEDKQVQVYLPTNQELAYSGSESAVRSPLETPVCIEFATNSRRIWSTNWKLEYVGNLSSRVGCRIGNWVTTAVGWVHTARHNSTQLNMFSFQIFYQIRRQSSWASCEFNTRRASSTRLNPTVESRRCRRYVLGLSTSARVWRTSVCVK